MTLKGNVYQQMEAEKVVEKYTKIAMFTGAIPVPLLDIAASTLAQIDMIKQLCKVYGVEYESQKAKAITSSIMTSVAVKMGSSIVKGVPIVGYVIGMPTQVALNGIVTYATGKAFITYVKGHQTINSIKDIDPTQFTKDIEKNIVKGLYFVKEKLNKVMNVDIDEVLDDKIIDRIQKDFPSQEQPPKEPNHPKEETFEGPQMSNTSYSDSDSLPKGQEKEAIKMKALSLFDSLVKTGEWFGTPNKLSEGKTPQQYMNEGRYEEVNTWLNILKETGDIEILKIKQN